MAGKFQITLTFYNNINQYAKKVTSIYWTNFVLEQILREKTTIFQTIRKTECKIFKIFGLWLTQVIYKIAWENNWAREISNFKFSQLLFSLCFAYQF